MDKWTRLDDRMLERRFLTEKNPALVNIERQSLSAAEEQGTWIVRQYCSLVRMIIEYLGLGMSLIPIHRVQTELARNIGEEQGSRTGGVPHRELLAKILRDELNMECFSPWSQATLRFHLALLGQFQTQAKNPVHIAGMIYALEASACPELLVVARIINSFAGYQVVNLDTVQDFNRSREIKTLEDFIAVHVIDFELGHKLGLCQTLDRFASTDWEAFELGFEFVLDTMAEWWEALSNGG
ncbi:MAG: hypothetical protein A2751_02145 [Candidatus Doudnabacteria bacterium RIFCSPHIGHO2_01_FULL_46_14]|uniref:Thiaminase-2/PQQC domain-containing protein n=1 Tax=Candidatus Doudnabacteria bacterium RIFCSPHIGHO2_01_FULL_46_14 TaxID=1817824 RepID=A0A1F5NJF9_9BACT|nr:MAG: hypothetical protein A2751_02145 [Candidatus Doudnabacteria bacterium RIFCSPHIGHO2_01_FULL_46_14]